MLMKVLNCDLTNTRGKKENSQLFILNGSNTPKLASALKREDGELCKVVIFTRSIMCRC